MTSELALVECVWTDIRGFGSERKLHLIHDSRVDPKIKFNVALRLCVIGTRTPRTKSRSCMIRKKERRVEVDGRNCRKPYPSVDCPSRGYGFESTSRPLKKKGGVSKVAEIFKKEKTKNQKPKTGSYILGGLDGGPSSSCSANAQSFLLFLVIRI